MKYFGEPFPSKAYPAPVFELGEKVETPVGQPCEYCGVPIKEGDVGFRFPVFGEPEEQSPWHRRCLLVSVVGEELADLAEERALREFGDSR